jgi:type I restriction enzyme, S subunit
VKQHHAGARRPANREQSGAQGVPEGWIVTTLSEVVRPSSTKTEPSASPDSRYLSLEHIEQDSGCILGCGTAGEVRSTKGVFRAGDVLYGKLRPYLNKVCTPDFDGICSTDILVFPRSALVESGYLLRFLMQQSTVEHAHHHSSGVQLPRVSFEKLGQIRFPLPPLAEQRRIVARVEALLGRVQAARARLAKVPALLKRFRQSVLAAACSGELTGDWREEHRPSESASDLLHRLAVERQKRWSNVVKTRYKSPEKPDADSSLVCPDEWTVASMDQLTILITSGSRDWSKYYARGSGTFIMAQNVRPGYLDLSFRQAVDPPEEHRDRVRSQVAVGDLLVTIVGANTGDVCPVTTELPEHYVCQSVSLMRPTDRRLCPYLNLYLNSTAHGRGQYDRYSYGEGRPHLSFDHLRMTAVLLPPIDEQHEIVRRVEALFALADKIESRVALATARVEKTTQAILAKAFRGELVPTEAELARQQNRHYEPASVLLERIRAEAEAADSSRPSRRMKKPS